MVIGKLVTEAVKVAVVHGTRLARYDKFAWNKLYTGLPQHVRKGTKHGFDYGIPIGGLLSGVTDLSDDGSLEDNGSIPTKSPTNQFNKTRHRRRGYSAKFGRFQRDPHNCRCSKRRSNNFRTR